MAEQRKTLDEYSIQGFYSHGWEDVTLEDSWKEARKRLTEYRENERGTAFRCVKRRVRIDN